MPYTPTTADLVFVQKIFAAFNNEEIPQVHFLLGSSQCTETTLYQILVSTRQEDFLIDTKILNHRLIDPSLLAAVWAKTEEPLLLVSKHATPAMLTQAVTHALDYEASIKLLLPATCEKITRGMFYALTHPQCPAPVVNLSLKSKLKHYGQDLWLLALAHPHCELKPNEDSYPQSGSVKEAVLRNPNCPEQWLRHAFASANKFNIWAVLSNPNCPVDLLLAATKDKTNLSVIVNNPNCPHDLLFEASFNSDKIKNVLYNPNCPVDLLLQVLLENRFDDLDVDSLLVTHPQANAKILLAGLLHPKPEVASLCSMQANAPAYLRAMGNTSCLR